MGNDVKCLFMQELNLTVADIAHWYDSKTPILLEAPPGSGKTYSVSEVMDKFAESKGIQILAVAPRCTTVLNMETEYAACKCVTEMTTQALQKKQNLGGYLNDFGILVIDEIHSMVTDVFNEANHVFMETLMHEFQGLVIGMTGTNFYNLESLFSDAYKKDWLKIEVAKDYRFLRENTIFFYKDDATAKFIIQQALANNQKIFVGCDHIETLEKLGECCKKQCFSIVSKKNKRKHVIGKVKDEVLKTFVESGKYPLGKEILLCTRSNEMGTSIFEKIDVIIVDSDDLSSILQFARRVRTAAGETVKIFVRAYNTAELEEKYLDAVKHLSMCELFERNETEFLERFHRYIDDKGGILYTAYNLATQQYDVRVNPLRYAYWKKRVEQFVLHEMRYWIHQVCNVFGGCRFQVLSKPELHLFMEQHDGQSLSKEEKKELKRVAGKKTIAGINKVCEQEKIEQRVVPERGNEWKNNKRSQPRHWVIKKGV